MVESCGLTLLKSPLKTFNYVLHLTTDDVHYIQINCHKCVLLAHSKRILREMKSDTYFHFTIKVLPGYLGAFLELLQYMYLKNPALITEKDKICHLMGYLEMPSEFYVLQNMPVLKKAHQKNSTHDIVQLHLYSDEGSCILQKDFLKTIRAITNTGICAQPRLLSHEEQKHQPKKRKHKKRKFTSTRTLRKRAKKVNYYQEKVFH